MHKFCIRIIAVAAFIAFVTTFNYGGCGGGGDGVISGSSDGITLSVAIESEPSLTTNPADNITADSAILYGTINPKDIAISVYFQYGKTTAYGINTIYHFLASGTSPIDVSAAITGLSANTTYNFRIAATRDGTNIYYGANQTFTTVGLPPTCVTNAANNITYNSVRLNGTVNPNGLDTNAYFQWGSGASTVSYGNTTTSRAIGIGTTSLAVLVDISGLSASTEYNFRVVATNSLGTTHGNNLRFTTAAPPVPTCTTNPATNITQVSATLGGTVNPNGVDANAYFQWGSGALTTSYGNTTTAQAIDSGTRNIVVTSNISELSLNTLYNFRVVGANTYGTTYGNNLTFTTGNSPGSKPTCTTNAATNITYNSVRLNGTVIPNGVDTTAYFNYGLIASYGNTTTTLNIGSGTTSLVITADISGLSGSRLYNFRVVGASTAGTTYGNNLTFTTAAPPPTCTTDAADNITFNSVRLNGTVNPNGSATDVYFNYGLAASYGNTTTSQNLGSGTSNVAVTDDISGLSASTQYNFRVVGTNSYGTTYGNNLTFTTATRPAPTCTTNAADNINSNSVRLNGTVNPNGLDTTAYFQWGSGALTTSYGNTTTSQNISSGISSAPINADIIGLLSSTQYNFRCVATNAGGRTNGLNQTFTTTAPPTPWSRQTYVKASNTGANDTGADDNFGYSVSLSGDTMVVGAYGEDSSTTGINSTPNEGATDSGAVYVFTRSGNTWSQQAYIKASNTGAYDYFGYSVALSGDTLVVGAIGEDSNLTGIYGNQYVADNSAPDSGAVYLFQRSGTTWSQQAYIKPSNTEVSDYFGYSVSFSGDTLVVGAYGEDSGATGINGDQTNNSASESGAVYVFTPSGTTWSQQAYIKASNTGASDNFGWSVSISGDTLVVGAIGEDSNANSATDSGAVYVFQRSGATWSQQAYIKPSNTGAGDWFGFSVAVSGDTLVVGSICEGSNTVGINSTPNETARDSGAVYVFQRSGTFWSQQAYIKASNTGVGDWFGFSVAVSGDTLIVGSYLEASDATGINGDQTNNSAPESGAVYLFQRSGTTWSQQAYIKASNTGTEDWFGYSVSLSGDTLVVGARYEDSNATGINGSQANNSATDSGAVYVFR